MKNRVVAFLFLLALLLGIFIFPMVFPHAKVILGINPAQGSETSLSTVIFEFKGVSNVSISNISLYGDWNGSWQANYTNSSYENNTWLNITVDGIPEGNHTWGVLVNNSEGYLNWSENRTFVIDNTAPVFVSVTNQTGFSNESFSYDVNATDIISLGSFSLNDTSIFSINSSTGLIENSTSLIEGGFFIYNLTVNDSLGNLNWTIFTINISRVHYPIIFLENLIDTYNSSSSSVTFEFRVIENTTIDTIQLFGDWSGNWTANYTNYTNNSYSSGDWLNITVGGISEGSYNWSVYANESDGNETWSINRTFTVDTIAPTITVVSPDNDEDFTDEEDVTFTVATDEPCSVCRYSVEDGSNTTMTATNSTWFTDDDTFSAGSNQDVLFYCTDYAGNIVSGSVSFDVTATTTPDDDDDDSPSSSSTSSTTSEEDEEEEEENGSEEEETQTFTATKDQANSSLAAKENLSSKIEFKNPFFKNIKNSMVGNSMFSVEIDFKDLEPSNSTEVLVNYAIRDLEGNIYFEGSEVTNLEEMNSYYRDFDVENLSRGKYVLEAQINNAGEIETIQSEFKVRPHRSFVIALIIGLIVLGGAAFIFFFDKIFNGIKNKKYLLFTRR